MMCTCWFCIKYVYYILTINHFYLFCIVWVTNNTGYKCVLHTCPINQISDQPLLLHSLIESPQLCYCSTDHFIVQHHSVKKSIWLLFTRLRMNSHENYNQDVQTNQITFLQHYRLHHFNLNIFKTNTNEQNENYLQYIHNYMYFQLGLYPNRSAAADLKWS